MGPIQTHSIHLHSNYLQLHNPFVLVFQPNRGHQKETHSQPNVLYFMRSSYIGIGQIQCDKGPGKPIAINVSQRYDVFALIRSQFLLQEMVLSGKKPLSKPKFISFALPSRPDVGIRDNINPDSKIHGVNIGPTWVLSAQGGPHISIMNPCVLQYPWTGRN